MVDYCLFVWKQKMRNQPIVKSGSFISISFSLFFFFLLWLGNGCAFWMIQPCHKYQQQNRGLFLSSSRKSVGRNGYNVTFLQQECQNDVTLYHELYTEYRWNKMFALLQQYEIQHGHAHVPYRTKYQNESLGRWITLIRRYKRQNQLSSKWIDKFTHELQTNFLWDNPPKRYPTKTKKSNVPPFTTIDQIITDGSVITDSSSLELLLPSEPMIFSTTAPHTTNEQQHDKQEEYNELCYKLFHHHHQNTTTTTNKNNLSMTSLCQTFSRSTSAQLTLWRMYTLPNLPYDPKYNFLIIQSPRTERMTNNRVDEYIQELNQFFKTYGHSYVPLAYPNSSLGTFIYNLRNNIYNDTDEGNTNIESKQMLQTLYQVDFEIDEISFQQKAFPVLVQLRTNASNNGENHDGNGYDYKYNICELFQEETNILLQQKGI